MKCPVCNTEMKYYAENYTVFEEGYKCPACKTTRPIPVHEIKEDDLADILSFGIKTGTEELDANEALILSKDHGHVTSAIR